MEPDRTSEDSDVAYETHYCSVVEEMKLITLTAIRKHYANL
jgi:hypothetical protein